MDQSIFLLLPFFLLGLLFGSFANVIILRLHSGKTGILSGRSECPNCHHVLGFFDLIPILSWIFLGGKCRHCRKPISWQYPLVELAMALLWLLVGSMTAVNIFAGNWQQFGELFFQLFLVSSLLIITVYDLKYLEIPDQLSLPTIGVLLISLFLPFTPNWTDALLGAAIPLGFFGLQILVSQGKWIGGGDLRLGTIMGLALGWQKTLLALFIAYLLGAICGLFLIIIGKKDLGSAMPFGPFLAIGTVAGMFWGKEILATYLHLLG